MVNIFGSFENVIKGRSTQRKFSQDHIPSKHQLQQIVEAGIYAPFPGLGTNRKQCPRLFIIIQNGTPEWDELKSIWHKSNHKFYRLSRKQWFLRLINWFTPRRYQMERKWLKECQIYGRMIEEWRGDFAHFDTAPFWVFIAEYRHVPFNLTKLIRQSMGHCLQNIWLMATNLGLVMQPISSVYQIQDKKRVHQILGLDNKGWELDSFLLGYPVKGQKPAKRQFNLEREIIWHVNQVD